MASASSGGGDPESLCSDMVGYARQAWRGGNRDAAVGVLEHGADLIARAAQGTDDGARASFGLALARTRLSWAAMQSVRRASRRRRCFPPLASPRPRIRRDRPPLTLPPIPPQDAGELSHAHDTLSAAASDARAADERAPNPADVVATNVAGAVNAARVYRTGTHTMDGVQIDAPAAAERIDDHLDAADAAADAAAAAGHPDAPALRVAALGARGLTAMATGDASAAAEAADAVVAALRRDEDDASVRSAADGPHGAAVAAALKTAAHWIALTGAEAAGASEPEPGGERGGEGDGDGRAEKEGDGSDGGADASFAFDVADDLYARAADVASSTASSTSPRAAHSALAADAVFADVRLAQAQLALRRAVSADADADADAARVRIAAAEEAAASAVTAAESLGDPNHPRVALAVACSADVYVAKAVLAAKGGGGVGDGAGVMFAEGLYRNALRMLGTPRHPTATADDPDAAAGGAARSHLRLAAALVHARYAAVLRASGANRAAEAEAWAAAAAREWPGSSDAGGAVEAAARGIGGVGRERVLYDAQLMIPIAADEWR